MTKSIESQTRDAVMALGTFIDEAPRTREDIVLEMIDLGFDNIVHAFECLTNCKGLYLTNGYGFHAKKSGKLYSLDFSRNDGTREAVNGKLTKLQTKK